jgi:hypothetical protein
MKSLTFLLMYGVLPLWILAGLADWWCHRRTSIETTTGLRESALHLFLFLQMGMGVAVALLLQINLLTLGVLALIFVLHEASTWFELQWVHGKRDIRAGEQMVHSFLEMLPLFALLMLTALHADAFGRWDDAGEWRVRWKAQPLPVGYLLASFLGAIVFNLLPLLEECWRCIRCSGAARPAAGP